MKVALVHDWLNQKIGGGERVLLKLAELYPEAPIYTLLYDKTKFGNLVDPARIHTSKLQHLPAVLRRRPRYLLPLIQRAIESFDLSGYDVVISSSVAFSKNVITRPETLHICYCHAPMRFAWDYWPAYLDEQRVGPLRRRYISRLVSRLRVWDYIGSGRVDKWVANSQTTARRIAKYYHQTAEVIYPPVATKWFSQAKQPPRRDYYVTLAMLTPYKKLDLAVEAFNISGERLLVIGEGSQRQQLEHIAKPNVEFTGYLDDASRRQTLAAARALVFPQEEDFGIAAVEAMAAGTPVIAYGRGGARETIIDGKTGLFFDEQTAVALNRAVERAKTIKFAPAILQAQANKFDETVFAKRLKQFVKQAYSEYVHTN